MNKHVILIDDNDRVLQILKNPQVQHNVPHKCTWAKSRGQAVDQITYLMPDMAAKVPNKLKA